jgi:hypothetical protein
MAAQVCTTVSTRPRRGGSSERDPEADPSDLAESPCARALARRRPELEGASSRMGLPALDRRRREGTGRGAPAVAALEVRCLPLCDTWLPSCPGMRSDGKGGVHGTRSRAPYGPQGPPRAHPRELANGVARRAAGACRSAAAPARRPRDHARAGRSRVRSPARGLPRARVPGRRLLPARAGRRGRGRRGARRLLRAPAVLSHRASAYTVSSRRLARAPG